MITAKRVFGSYVKETVSLDDIAPLTKDQQWADAAAVDDDGCAIPSEWTELPLVEKRSYNHDTSFFRFLIPAGKKSLNLPLGHFLLVKCAGSDGQEIIRPYVSISDDDDDDQSGSFEILCKRYDEWGQKESPDKNFLFTKTDHSYKPPGLVSTFIHQLAIGASLAFMHNIRCVGGMGLRLRFDFSADNGDNGGHGDRGSLIPRVTFRGEDTANESPCRSITMIAVGVGLAPMIHTLRAIFKARERRAKGMAGNNGSCSESSGDSGSSRTTNSRNGSGNYGSSSAGSSSGSNNNNTSTSCCSSSSGCNGSGSSDSSSGQFSQSCGIGGEGSEIDGDRGMGGTPSSAPAQPGLRISLLYGVRTVANILMREQLEDWRVRHQDCFRVCYCVGSRFANVHMGYKKKGEYLPPPPPDGFEEISDHAELGWVNEDKVKRHGFAPSEDTAVVVCGLPGVYDKLCGPRAEQAVGTGSALQKLGYTARMVIKL